MSPLLEIGYVCVYGHLYLRWDCVEEIIIWYYSADTMLIPLSKNKTTPTIFESLLKQTFLSTGQDYGHWSDPYQDSQSIPQDHKLPACVTPVCVWSSTSCAVGAPKLVYRNENIRLIFYMNKAPSIPGTPWASGAYRLEAFCFIDLLNIVKLKTLTLAITIVPPFCLVVRLFLIQGLLGLELTK